MSEFDPAQFDEVSAAPVQPQQSAQNNAAQARAAASFERMAADSALTKSDVAEIKAFLAERAVVDEQHNKTIGKVMALFEAHIVKPDRVYTHAEVGAKQGASEGLLKKVKTLQADIVAAVSDITAPLKDQLQVEATARNRLSQSLVKQHKREWIMITAVCVAFLLIPLVGLKAYDTGVQTGTAASRDEVAHASWANTPDGLLARKLSAIDPTTLAHIAYCDRDGWQIDKHGVCVPYANRGMFKDNLLYGWRVKP